MPSALSAPRCLLVAATGLAAAAVLTACGGGADAESERRQTPEEQAQKSLEAAIATYDEAPHLQIRLVERDEQGDAEFSGRTEIILDRTTDGVQVTKAGYDEPGTSTVREVGGESWFKADERWWDWFLPEDEKIFARLVVDEWVTMEDNPLESLRDVAPAVDEVVGKAAFKVARADLKDTKTVDGQRVLVLEQGLMSALLRTSDDRITRTRSYGGDIVADISYPTSSLTKPDKVLNLD